MDEHVAGGKHRLESMAERLTAGLADDEGNHPAPDEVAEVVAEQAERLADAPVQDFVPLLTEHQARDELRQRGLHADPSQPPADPSGPDPVDER